MTERDEALKPKRMAQPAPDLDLLLESGLILEEIEFKVRSYCAHWALHKARCHHGDAALALCVHRNTLSRILGLTERPQ